MSRSQFIETLDRMAEKGMTVDLWLRDDDAVEPTSLLARLLGLSAGFPLPITLAVIPARATTALADLLRQRQEITVAVHGWDHTNHAAPTEKKQELGLQRGETIVLGTLADGLRRIHEMFGARAVPLLVPPWNRIAPSLVTRLPALGYEALSVFGPEKAAPLRMVNTHVDIIDWKGSRGGRAAAELYGEATDCLITMTASTRTLGILTHHLVHDEAAWDFLEDFLEVTGSHPACRWISVRELMVAD